jgi:hypothetical protein
MYYYLNQYMWIALWIWMQSWNMIVLVTLKCRHFRSWYLFRILFLGKHHLSFYLGSVFSSSLIHRYFINYFSVVTCWMCNVIFICIIQLDWIIVLSCIWVFSQKTNIVQPCVFTCVLSTVTSIWSHVLYF